MSNEHGVLSFKDSTSDRALTKLIDEDARQFSTGRSTVLRQIVVAHYRKNRRLKDEQLPKWRGRRPE